MSNDHKYSREAANSANEDNLHGRNLLNRVMLILSILTGTGIIATAFFFKRKVVSFLIILALFSVILTAKFLLQRNHIRKASSFTVSSVWLIFSFIIILGGGLDNINVIFYISLTIVAGLLLGEQATIVVAGAGIAMGFGLALMAIFGLLPDRYFLSPPLGKWSELVFALILSASTLNMALRERNDALTNAKKQLSERIETEKALRESTELYDKLISTIPDMVVRTNIDGEIQFVNDMALTASGYERSELIGKNMISFIAPEDQERAINNTILMMENALGPKQYKLVMKDGEKRVFEVNGDVLRKEGGEPYNIVMVLRDITDRVEMEQERKELQERLYRAEKMEALGALAGGVAHDLNNILSGIVSYPDLLLMQLPKDSPTAGPIRTIRDSGTKAAAIVQDLLTMARRGASINDSICLNELVCEYLESHEFISLSILHPGLRVTKHLSDDLPNIMGSRVHLFKTLMNLVINAAEAMPEGGPIDIRTYETIIDKPVKKYEEMEAGRYVTLAVSDAGIGIPEKDQSRIFEPFYTKKQMGRSGSGLGLAVVWGTVKDHRGYIDIESAGTVGTTFKLYFPPTLAEPESASTTIDLEACKGSGETILVVDDIYEQRKIASEMLNKIGYAVEAVESGETAISFLKGRQVDLVILDMIMEPGMDGLDTYLEIKKQTPGQKVLIASGFSESNRVLEAQKQGAGSYIKKPYSMKTLAFMVRKELDCNDSTIVSHKGNTDRDRLRKS